MKARHGIMSDILYGLKEEEEEEGGGTTRRVVDGMKGKRGGGTIVEMQHIPGVVCLESFLWPVEFCMGWISKAIFASWIHFIIKKMHKDFLWVSLH